MQRVAIPLFLGSMFLLQCGDALADDAPLNPADYVKPVCPANYTMPDAGTCTATTTAIAALGKDKCIGAGVTWKADATPAVCVASTPAAKPQCKPMAGYTAKLADGACTYSKTIASSGIGDYIGDCFRVDTVPPGTDLIRQRYFVSAQKNLDNGDRELTLLKGTLNFLKPVCLPDPNSGTEPSTATASQLMNSGAVRTGWTYGALTMPYKYYPSTKTFSVNAPIGAYLGLRTGLAGSGHTYAMAFTLSTVKADTLDPKTLVDGKPAVTGTSDVAALSLAAGMMWDILKSPAGKPFKAGIFVGVDRVSRSPSVSYAQNGKAWFALQLGYDFTDN